MVLVKTVALLRQTSAALNVAVGNGLTVTVCVPYDIQPLVVVTVKLTA